jgi:hypothetical protein
MSNSAEIEDTIVEVGGESKVHKDLADVHMHIGGRILDFGNRVHFRG